MIELLVVTCLLVCGLTAWAVPILTKAWIERTLGHRFDKALEDLKYDIRVREQAAKAAEYLSCVWQLNKEDEPSLYRRANQLSWELALFLPADVYRHVVKAVAAPDTEANVLTAVCLVRKTLLEGNAGDLTSNDIAFHAPGAGNINNPRDNGGSRPPG